MKKKTLKGFLKTRHFSERQKQRQVSDQEIAVALTNGDLSETEGGHQFILGNLKVTVDLGLSTLITVHPGDPTSRATKLLTSEEARKIRELIVAHQLSLASTENPAISDTEVFLNYVSEASVKKI